MIMNNDMYEMSDEDNEEMSKMIDEERMEEYHQTEYTCLCGAKFNADDTIEGDDETISCPACGDEMERDEGYEDWVRSL